jgi:hypothetical protein
MPCLRARSSVSIPLSLSSMAAVARTNLRKLKFSSDSKNKMAAVARVNLRGLSLPRGSWDSHVHVIDEVGPTLQLDRAHVANI